MSHLEIRLQRNDYWLDDGAHSQGMGRRTAGGAVVTFSGQVLRFVLQIGSSAILSRLLAPADFGLFTMAITVSTFVVIFADMGLSAATVQARVLTQKTVSSLFYATIGISVAAMLLTLALGAGAAWFYGDFRVFPLSACLALAIPITAVASQHNALLGRRMRWISTNAIALCSQLAGAILAIAAAWFYGFGYWALAIQSVVTAIVATAMSWMLCNWRPSMTFDYESCRSEMRFGLHMTGFTISNYFHRQIDKVLIGRRWGATELGHYSRSYNILLAPIGLVNNSIGQVVVPLLSRHQDDPEKWRSYMLMALSFNCFGGCAITTLLVGNSDDLIAILLGPGWDYSAKIFFYLGLSLYFMSPMNAMGWVFMSLGQTDRWFRWGLFTAAAFPVVFLVALPHQALGVAKAYSLAVAALSLPALAYAFKNSAATLGDAIGVIRGPMFVGAITLAATLLGQRHIVFSTSPLLSFCAWSAFIAAIYGLLSLLVLMFDPAQKAQKDLCLVLVKGLWKRFR